MMFALLSGHYPFDSTSLPNVVREAKRGDIRFPDEAWSSISAEGASPSPRCLHAIKPFVQRKTLFSAYSPSIPLEDRLLPKHNATSGLRSLIAS